MKSMYATMPKWLAKHIFSMPFFSSFYQIRTLKTSVTNSSHHYSHGIDKFLYSLHHSRSNQSLNKIHSLLVIAGLIQNHSFAREIIHKYISFGFPELALSSYRSISTPSLLLQNLTIRWLSDHCFFSEILNFYFRLQYSYNNLRADEFAFPLVIKACAVLGAQLVGKQAHCSVLRTGYGGHLVVQTALLEMYARTDCMAQARKVFDEMHQRDLVSWNALINGYSSNGYGRDAFVAFREMLACGLMPNASTLVSVLPICSQVGEFSTGESLYCFAIKCGTSSDESLAPTLITTYAGFGNLYAARMLFELLLAKDVVAWNAMITAYAQSGESFEAFEAFQLMHQSGVRPNLVTLVSVHSSCSELADSCYGMLVHALGIKFGLADIVGVVTSLVSMYAKHGEFDAAQCLFNSVPEKDLLLWNSMASAYLQVGIWWKSLETFSDMLTSCVTPDSISLINVISACSISQDLWSGKSGHAYCVRNGFDANTNVMNALMAFYSDCDQLCASMKLFHGLKLRNVISWNTLISGLTRTGDIEGSLVFFRQMSREVVKFDLITLISIIPGFKQAEELVQGMSFHDLVIRCGYNSDTSLSNALISMYANCGDIAASKLLFSGLSMKSVVSWNALMTAFRDHYLFSEVILLFDEMKMEGQTPNSVTLLNLLPICSNQLQGKSIHAFAIRNFFFKDSPLLTSTMCMYARFDNLNYCCLLFEMLDKRNVVAWNTLMSVYLQCKHVGKMVTCFKEMLLTGIKPDSVTILNLVSACAVLGSLELAQCVMCFIIHEGFNKNISVINSLIDMYTRCGSISMARDLFDGVKEKDNITWGAMINGLGIHGDGVAALELFSEMQEAGVQPDDITFVSILSACSHSGLVEQAQSLFTLMIEEHQIEPRMEHYACMVDLFARTGRLQYAYDLVRTLPFKPTANLLESLLGACQSHGNSEVGEGVGKLLAEFNNCTSSSWVMLSNMYALDGRWLDSGTMRHGMEKRCLRKEPGVSLIEVR